MDCVVIYWCRLCSWEWSIDRSFTCF